jgi:hypothetical protein
VKREETASFTEGVEVYEESEKEGAMSLGNQEVNSER